MNYKNARAVAIHDRVVAQSHAGKFIGTVVAIEGEHLRVMPLYSQSAHYCDPAQTLHVDDALKPDAEVAPAPAAAEPAPAATSSPESAAAASPESLPADSTAPASAKA